MREAPASAVRLARITRWPQDRHTLCVTTTTRGPGPGPGPDAAIRRRERRGWYLYDWANQSIPTTVVTVFIGPYLTTVAGAAADADGYVHPLGLAVRHEAVFPFAVAISVILQVLVMPLSGALADHSGRKRELLALFTYVGALATMSLFFLEGTRYLLGVALFCLAFYLNREAFGLDEGTAVRICLLSAGVWWALFALIPLKVLRNRIAPPSGESAGRAVTTSLRQLGMTLADLGKRPITLLFLLAYLIYSDGVSTIINLPGTYAVHELRLDQSVVIAAILLVQFVAFGGALLLGWLARIFGAKRVVLAALLVWTVVVLASYTLQVGAAGQFILLAVVIGIVMGGTQTLSRSLFSHLRPWWLIRSS